MSLLILSSSDVEQITSNFPISLLQSLMAQVFHTLSTSSYSSNPSEKSIDTPHRTTIAMSSHHALFMPSRIASLGTTIKVVSVPTNPKDTRGLPASTFVMDEETGRVKAVVNAGGLTAVRTAAGSLLATTLLYPSEVYKPTNVVAYGAGQQIKAHVDLLLKTYTSITNVTIVNRTQNSRLASLVSWLHTQHPNVSFTCSFTSTNVDSSASRADSASFAVAPSSDIPSILKKANIIVTATSSTTPLFPSAHVSSGTHIILVGSYKPTMHEIDTELVHRANGAIIVDSREACFVEAGEFIDAGVTTQENGVVEVGALVRSKEGLGRNGGEWAWERDVERCEALRKKGDVTIWKSVGVGAQDVAIAAAVVKRAEEIDVGTVVEGYDP